MDKFYDNYSRNSKEKDKALDKIKEERAKRHKIEVETKTAKVIQEWWRQKLIYRQYINSIYQDVDKKIKDIETLSVYLLKNKNTKFTVPVNIHCQLIVNLNICYTYYARRLLIRRPLFTKCKKKDNVMFERLKECLSLFEKLIQFSIAAVENPKNLENIYFYSVVEGKDLDKAKKELKHNSLVNLKVLLRLSFLTLAITNSTSEIYQTSTVNKTMEFLHLVLDPQAYLKYGKEVNTTIYSIYQMVISLSNEMESKKKLLNRVQFEKPLVQVFGNILQRSISIKKDDIPDEYILQIIQIIVFITNMYCALDCRDRNTDKNSYDFFLKFQSDFFIYLMAIPRFAKFMKPIIDESVFQQLPKKYTLNKSNLDIFHTRFWKDVFQAFLFNNFRDPYLPVINLADDFRKKFDSTNQIYFVLGNVIEIFYYQIIDLPVYDYFSTIKIISLCCHFVTTNWLVSIISSFEVDRDYWCLKDQINKLFATQFVQDLFFKIFEIRDSTEEEKIEVVTTKGKKKVNTTPLDPSSHIHFPIIDLYSYMLALCQPADELQVLVTNFANALAFNKIFLRRLYKTFKVLYLDLINNKKDHYYFELPLEMFSLLDIFVTLYYNFLIITDTEDFVNHNHFSQTQVFELTRNILKLAVNLNWNLDVIKENKIRTFFAFQAAKLMRLIQEFNQTLNFINTKDHVIDKSWVKYLKQDVAMKNPFRVLFLKRLPFTIPFEARLAIFHDFLQAEREYNPSQIKIMIRRTNLFEDGFNAFCKMNAGHLRGKLAVTFVDEFGMPEEGIDAGGLFKEFLLELSKIVFNPSYGLFRVTENEQTLYPNPESINYLGAEHLEIFYFVGLIVGRAMYDNILIETEFAQFFLRKILGKINYVNELQSLDKEMFNNLKFLKSYQGDVTDLCLTFSVTDSTNSEIELVPGGKQMSVTNDNKFKYIYSVANHKLHTEIKNQSKAFMSGLSVFVAPDWLQIFNEEELQIVMSGTKKPFDVDDLKSHTTYKGYMGFDSTVRDFWKVFAELTEQEKILVLKFVTSCSRPPLLGFSHLHPPFTIQYVENPDGEKLPTASTCFNILKLPKYSDKKKLKAKLLLAIKSGSGFHMA